MFCVLHLRDLKILQAFYVMIAGSNSGYKPEAVNVVGLYDATFVRLGEDRPAWGYDVPGLTGRIN